MKVMMLGWEFPPRVSGGLGTACAGLVRGLTQQEVEVLFVLPRCEHGSSSSGARVVGAEQAARAQAGLELRPVSSALRPYQGARAYARGSLLREDSVYAGDLFAEVERYARVVAGMSASEPCDLFHAHDWMAYAAGAAAARRTGRPWVAHVHATEDDRNQGSPDERITEIEAEGLRQADRVLCVSRYSAERVQRRYGVPRSRMRVLHNATEKAKPATRKAPRSARRRVPTVLFLGRVTSQKGPGLFLEAAARVHAELPQARFLVAGSGDLLAPTIERAAELGLARQVRFTGFLDPDRVSEVFGHADVFVLPSVSEPFGIAPLEALAHDVPVILSRHSGVAELIPSAPRVDPWDAAELGAEILRLLRAPELRRELCASARRELANVTWESRGVLLRTLYEELLA